MQKPFQSYSIKCFCSLWKCCETFGERCFKIGKLILPSICFQAILSPLDRSCLSYEIFKSIESCKLNKTTYNSPHIIKWTDTPQWGRGRGGEALKDRSIKLSIQKRTELNRTEESKMRTSIENIARIANAVQLTLWLSVTNPQCHDFISSICH